MACTSINNNGTLLSASHSRAMPMLGEIILLANQILKRLHEMIEATRVDCLQREYVSAYISIVVTTVLTGNPGSVFHGLSWPG